MAFDWTEKIRALLELAENESTEEARATFLVKAQELMVKHSIDEAMIRAAGGNEIGGVDGEIWFREDKTSLLIKAKRELLSGLANLNRCKLISHGKSGRDYMTLVGFESDRKAVAMMFTSVMLQLQTDMSTQERLGRVSGPLRGWRVSFAHGYGRRVYARLRDAQARQMASATDARPGSALVLRDQSALVADRFQQMFPNTISRKTSLSINNREGYAAGDAAGYRADLGGFRVGGTDRKMI
jgi:hypothetical protein